jgi:hypothetical protein
MGKVEQFFLFSWVLIVFRCNMLRNMAKFNDSKTRGKWENVLFTENFSTPACLAVYLGVSRDFPVFFFLPSSLSKATSAMFEILRVLNNLEARLEYKL